MSVDFLVSSLKGILSEGTSADMAYRTIFFAIKKFYRFVGPGQVLPKIVFAS